MKLKIEREVVFIELNKGQFLLILKFLSSKIKLIEQLELRPTKITQPPKVSLGVMCLADK